MLIAIVNKIGGYKRRLKCHFVRVNVAITESWAKIHNTCKLLVNLCSLIVKFVIKIGQYYRRYKCHFVKINVAITESWAKTQNTRESLVNLCLLIVIVNKETSTWYSLWIHSRHAWIHSGRTFIFLLESQFWTAVSTGDMVLLVALSQIVLKLKTLDYCRWEGYE